MRRPQPHPSVCRNPNWLFTVGTSVINRLQKHRTDLSRPYSCADTGLSSRQRIVSCQKFSTTMEKCGKEMWQTQTNIVQSTWLRSPFPSRPLSPSLASLTLIRLSPSVEPVTSRLDISSLKKTSVLPRATVCQSIPAVKIHTVMTYSSCIEPLLTSRIEYSASSVNWKQKPSCCRLEVPYVFERNKNVCRRRHKPYPSRKFGICEGKLQGLSFL